MSAPTNGIPNIWKFKIPESDKYIIRLDYFWPGQRQSNNRTREGADDSFALKMNAKFPNLIFHGLYPLLGSF